MDNDKEATDTRQEKSEVILRRKSNTSAEDRNLRRVSYLRATKDFELDIAEEKERQDEDQHQETQTEDSKGADGLRHSHSIQKIISVFSKIVDSPLSPTSSGNKLDDLPKQEASNDIQKEGWLELKVTEKIEDSKWKNVYVVLRSNGLFFFRNKNSSRDFCAPYEEDPVCDVRIDVCCDPIKKRTVLKLKQDNGPTYWLETESESALQSWLRHLEETFQSETKYSRRWSRRSLTTRTRSPTSQSPVNKLRKASAEQSQACFDNRKSWRGKVSKQWKKIHTTSPSASPVPENGSIGVPLDECPLCSEPEFDRIPYLLRVCCKIVEERGLSSVGIYRVPGNSSAVMALTEQVNKGTEHFKLEDPRWNDVNVVSSLLKSFFRKLPDPICTLEMYSVFITMSKIDDPEKRLLALKQLIHDLPEINYETLKFLCFHLCKVIQNSASNKMDLRNLSIVFGPSLVRTSDDNMLSMVTDMAHQCKIIESILSNVDWCFNDSDLESPPPFIPSDDQIISHTEAEITPVSEFSEAGYQSLLICNLQKLEESERGGHHTREVGSAKDIVSGILSVANRKKLRANKMKKDSSDRSTSLGGDLIKPQLWLDLSDPDIHSGAGGMTKQPLHGAGSLFAAVPQIMGTLVGAHSNWSEDSSPEKPPLFLKYHPDTTSSSVESSSLTNHSNRSEATRSEENSTDPNLCSTNDFSQSSEIANLSSSDIHISGDLLQELTATFDEKLRLLSSTEEDSSFSEVETPDCSQNSDQNSLERRKSEITSSISSLYLSPQQRSISLDHSAADFELLRDQLEAICLRERSKKSDLKRGKQVEKCKEPYVRQRNSVATKHRIGFDERLATGPCDVARKSEKRRHTVAGVVSLWESHLAELTNQEREKIKFALKLETFDFNSEHAEFTKKLILSEAGSNFHLRSSSPDLFVCFRDRFGSHTPSLKFASCLESRI